MRGWSLRDGWGRAVAETWIGARTPERLVGRKLGEGFLPVHDVGLARPRRDKVTGSSKWHTPSKRELGGAVEAGDGASPLENIGEVV